MVSEIQEKRNLIRNLADQIRNQDKKRVSSLMREPALVVKELFQERIDQMQDFDIPMPTERAFVRGNETRIKGIAIKDYSKGENLDRPVLTEDGHIYMCPDWPNDPSLLHWDKRREPEDAEILQNATSLLASLEEVINWHLNPSDPYALGEGF